ncbi:hypothetical protein BDV95DRAFT_598122 [Massariosphaeria phaeospora]|uniref:DOMON domain-containing protein n=1 Tax=Massariosphaeria phaeospora TaxID=100035 RepID=A0A7C8M3A0_9PLEO|nr:hypothetical protein BDV95DRAFT_598122 [Massariosphaeria phaeospora]
MAIFQRVGALFALLTFFPSLIQAQNPAASTFFLEETETQFSVNIANDTKDTKDVYIYFTSPAYSWVGVGFGETMEDSLMFILYLNREGNNVTISPRIADGNSEPTVARDIRLETLNGTGVVNDMFVVRAVCRNCRVWRGGAIDINNAAHPMIYAFGHGNALQSDALDAPLKRHIRYGRFAMNMLLATGKGEVPSATKALSGVELKGDMTRDHDRANLAHAVIGSLALFVLWPLNVIFAGFFRNIKIHVGVSILIMAFLITAYGLGISTSSQFNRTKSFTSPHQIFAFISILPILLMSLLPIIRPLASLAAIVPRLHTPLTTLTFTLLVITGGLGLLLSSAPRPIILVYVALALLVSVFLLLTQTCIQRRGSAHARATTRQRLGEDDEQDLVLAAYYAGKKCEDASRSASQASESSDASAAYTGGHARSASANRDLYGGGTMPGPQYLLNMHPGVPVHRW